MDRFIPDNYECAILIYGIGRCGKTTIVEEIVNIIENRYDEPIPKMVITSTREDYNDGSYQKIAEYDKDTIDRFVHPAPFRRKRGFFSIFETEEIVQRRRQGAAHVPKILILDDFMHTKLNNTHFQSLLSTTRKDDKHLNLIVSTHALNKGTDMRTMCHVYIILKTSKKAKELIYEHLELSADEYRKIRTIIMNNKYSFLIFNTYGEWDIFKIAIE